MWVSIVLPVTLWVLLHVTLQKKVQTPPVSLTEAASHDWCSSSVVICHILAEQVKLTWAASLHSQATFQQGAEPYKPPHGSIRDVPANRTSACHPLWLCLHLPRNVFLHFFLDFTMSLFNTQGARCQCIHAPGFGGRSSADRTSRWRCSGTQSRKCLDSQWRKHQQWYPSGWDDVSEWFTTHTFCTGGRQPRCAPAAGVCTCNGQGSSKSEGHTGMPDIGILEPDMARGGVAQKEPPQSRSCAACTCKRKRVFVLAKVCAVSREDHRVARYCTCVCRNTACRAQWVYSPSLLEPHSSRRACSSAAEETSFSCMPHTALEWTECLHHHRPQSFKRQTKKKKQPEILLDTLFWCFCVKSWPEIKGNCGVSAVTNLRRM